jgi:activating signal cointegrator 1
MKALTLWQPWASLVAMEHKAIETRCWSTKYRGELAIHSAARLPAKYLGASSRQDAFRDQLADIFNVRRDRDDRAGMHVDDVLRLLPYGKILCVVRLTEVTEIDEMLRETIGYRERLFGNYEDGRYAWHLEKPDIFEQPIPAKGNRMLWNWEPPTSADRFAARYVRMVEERLAALDWPPAALSHLGTGPTGAKVRSGKT